MPKQLKELIERPQECIPQFVNEYVALGDQSISEHLIKEHNFPTNTVISLTVDERYVIHDELHDREVESIVPNYKSKNPYLVYETVSFYHYLKDRNVLDTIKDIDLYSYLAGVNSTLD